VTLKQTIYLSLAAVAVVIGIHRIMVDGQSASISEAIGYNYWIFMLALVFLMLYRYDKKKQKS
jgi:hypothetical protein